MPAAGIGPSPGPFQEALDFFRKKVNMPVVDWVDLTAEERLRAFTVAGVTKADLLADIRDAVDKAIEQGTTLETFKRDFNGIIEKHGWNLAGTKVGYRARLIFEQNIRVAYTMGREAQLRQPAFQARNPYWQWLHGDSKRPRPNHLAWDGTILPADDPFWVSNQPGVLINCRCKKVAMSGPMMKAEGLKVSKQPPQNMWDKLELDQQPSTTSAKAFATDLLDMKTPKLPNPISDDLRREIEAQIRDNEAWLRKAKAGVK